jgi:hypothetical protein
MWTCDKAVLPVVRRGRRTVRLPSFGLWILSSFGLSGCEGAPAAPEPEVVGVVLVSPENLLLTEGESELLGVQARSKDGITIGGRRIKWSSSDLAVATVSDSGRVRAVLPGRSTVTATIDGISGTTVVRVTGRPVASLHVSQEQLNLRGVGAKDLLTVEARDASGRPLEKRELSWTSSDTTVVNVKKTSPSTAEVVSSGPGHASIRIMTDEVETEVLITVLALQDIIILNKVTSLHVSQQYVPQVYGRYADGDYPLHAGYAIQANANILRNINDSAFVAVKAGMAVIAVSQDGIDRLFSVPVVDLEELPLNVDMVANGNCDVTVPVAVVTYFPTEDGVVHNDRRGPSSWNMYKYPPLSFTKRMVYENVIATKRAVEEGTRFRDYGRNVVRPYVCINIIKYYHVYSVDLVRWGVPDIRVNRLDYKKLFDKINMRELVEDLGVKEVWLGGFQNFGNTAVSLDPNPDREHFWGMPESNMASPYTGDISNSWRIPDDLPIYNKTYIVYALVADSGVGTHLHVRGHQFEVMMHYLDRPDARGLRVFEDLFVGRGAGPVQAGESPYSRNGRSGNTHFPPNANKDYEYWNKEYIETDIMDWRPDGGKAVQLNSDAWLGIKYNFTMVTPDVHNAFNPAYANNRRYTLDWAQLETMWHIFWQQSVPGRDNNISYIRDGKEMVLTNWWEIFYDWDAAIMQGKQLWKPK